MPGPDKAKITAGLHITPSGGRRLRGRAQGLAVCWGGLILLMLSACEFSTGGQHRSASHAREDSTMPTPALKQQIEKPPMDRWASPDTATATFALG